MHYQEETGDGSLSPYSESEGESEGTIPSDSQFAPLSGKGDREPSPVSSARAAHGIIEVSRLSREKMKPAAGGGNGRIVNRR